VDREAPVAPHEDPVSLGFDAASNVFKEFWPDIKRRVLKR